MSNPFKKITDNSEKTKKKWDFIKETSNVNSKLCNSCGAPRPKKTNLTTCAYCDSQFMNIQEQIISDI